MIAPGSQVATSSPPPRIAIIPGDPAGIGPELVAKLLAEPGLVDLAPVVLIGDRHVFEMGQRQAAVHWTLRDVSADGAEDRCSGDGVPLLALRTIAPEDLRPATVSEAGGRASLRALDRALDLALADQVDAVLFAPFNKSSLHLAGMAAEDEQRYIARYIGFTGHHSEINLLDELITTRVTSHIAIKDVAVAVDEEGIVKAIVLAQETLRAAGKERPRIGVAALNPHAGDNDKFGTEEIDILAPAIARARRMQIDVDGPWPSDTVFLKGRDGLLDAVVTMYHDQGQIAMKLLGFERGVTIAAGLPIPVATPAHGTAFDIAGQGVAKLTATRKAFEVLCRLGSDHRRRQVA